MADEKANTHTKYYVDGKEVPSCTTVLKIVDTDTLPNWANSLGFKHLSYNKELSKYSRIGTFAHALIERDIVGECEDLLDKMNACTDEEKIQANTAYNNYKDFVSEHEYDPFHSELQLTSKEYMFGGTIDCICNLDGKTCVLDFKTSNYFGKKMFMQLAGYLQLIKESDLDIEIQEVVILKLSKTETKYELLRIPVEELKPYFTQFRLCLMYYKQNKFLEEDWKLRMKDVETYESVDNE